MLDTVKLQLTYFQAVFSQVFVLCSYFKKKVTSGFFFFNYTILLNFRRHVLWPRQIQAKLPTVGISPCNKNGSFMMTCEATQAAESGVSTLFMEERWQTGKQQVI